MLRRGLLRREAPILPSLYDRFPAATTALRRPRGIRRLWALNESRVNFYAAEVLPGGCFFANAEFEFNARPGPVRDRLVEIFEEWMTLLERLVSEAIAEGGEARTRPAPSR